ncbi:MAG: hypothetical protein C0402_07240 [Thermodesulfovibrio sp.]|nr:hypothetical protein [Thermodesulfovibrio sp.]
MEQRSEELHPAPGQLWKNVRTGDLLFIYRKNGQIEGISGEGKKISVKEVMRTAHHGCGWACVVEQSASAGGYGEHDSYEFRAS